MRNVKLTLLMVLLFVGCLGEFTSAYNQIITSVSRGGTSTNTPPQIAPTLLEDSRSFVDQENHYYTIPTNYLGAEYVKVANDDRTKADYSLAVTLSSPARLYLFLDNRLGHGDIPGGDPALNPDLWAAGMGWVYTMGFVDTGDNIGIYGLGGPTTYQWSSVYVKYVSPGVTTLLQQNDPTNPVDRNMYGVAALKQGAFQTFEFYSNKLTLVQTPGWVTVPSGYFGGWYWWDNHGYWYGPYEGDSEPSDVYGGMVDVVPNPYPFDKHPLNCSPWQGDNNFWAFNDRLTFRYNDMKVRRLSRNFYFWSTGTKGNCLHILARDGGSGCPEIHIHVLLPEILSNLEVAGNQFSVNGGNVEGEFSPMIFINPGYVLDYFRSLPGVSEADVQTFRKSDTYREITDTGGAPPPPELKFGVQHAQWEHPEPPILCPEHLEITRSEIIIYPVALRQQPPGPVTVNVVSLAYPLHLEDSDANGVLKLSFDQANWDQPQYVSITSNLYGLIPRPVMLAHYMADDPTNGVVFPVTILDRATGGRGYLATDINRDTITNFKDLALVAAEWLQSTWVPEPVPWNSSWQSQDIGTTGGSATYDDVNEVWTIDANGANIWDTQDQFHYVYQQRPGGDYQLTVTVHDLENTHEWAKAGVMVRDELTPDSRHVMIVITPERGVAFQWRPSAGAHSQSIHGGPGGGIRPPVSLRIARIGKTVTGYFYYNGQWKEQGSVYLDAGSIAPYFGMAATSHVEGVLTTATFGNDLISTLPIPLP